MAYGNFINRVKENIASQTPEVGMGATLIMWSDREPFTIHRISENGKKLWASNDKAVLVEGSCQSENQVYEFSNDNQENEEMWQLFTLRKDKKWHRGTTLGGSVLLIGKRDKYYDPTF